MKRVLGGTEDRQSRSDLACLLGEILDLAIALMNESYVVDALRNEREAQSLREVMIGQDIAVDCERARAALFDWMRRLTTWVHAPEARSDDGHMSLLSSDFGMWLMFKAEVVIGEMTAIRELRLHAQGIEEKCTSLARAIRDDSRSVAADLLKDVDAQVTAGAVLLSSLAEKVIAQESGRDPLTRLLNRRYLPTVLQRETNISNRHQCHYVLLLVDIDHFKALNDRYGHDAGDAALKQVAEVILQNVRASDFVFRYGGEEFLVVCGNVASEQALHVAEKLRSGVEDHQFNIGDGFADKVTVSIGVALSDGHPDYNRIVSRADRALYEAKAQGRNRCFADEMLASS